MTSLAATVLAAAATLAQDASGFSVSQRVASAPADSSFGELFRDGGIMMWPITFCAIAVAVLAARAAWRMRADPVQQGGSVRPGIDGVLFWGVYASVLGVLGTVVGITLAAQAVEAVGEVHPTLLSGGIKVALLTTIYGLLILLLAALLWFGLRQWHRREALGGA